MEETLKKLREDVLILSANTKEETTKRELLKIAEALHSLVL